MIVYPVGENAHCTLAQCCFSSCTFSFLQLLRHLNVFHIPQATTKYYFGCDLQLLLIVLNIPEDSFTWLINFQQCIWLVGWVGNTTLRENRETIWSCKRALCESVLTHRISQHPQACKHESVLTCHVSTNTTPTALGGTSVWRDTEFNRCDCHFQMMTSVNVTPPAPTPVSILLAASSATVRQDLISLAIIATAEVPARMSPLPYRLQHVATVLCCLVHA